MENFILLAVLTLIIGGAGIYVYKAKKRGVKCIGCPAGGGCSKKNNGGSCSACNGNCGDSCNCHKDTE